jgi:hypothetical protein
MSLLRVPVFLAAILFGIAMVAAAAAGLWLVPVVWIPLALGLLAVRHGLSRGRTRWIWLGILLAVIVACPVLVFEGGLFVLPAAVVLFVADARKGDPTRRSRLATDRR